MTELVSGCKINLYLLITGRLENGYHSLDSLFIPLAEPHDRIEVDVLENAPGRFTLECSTPGIDPENNTLTKACRLYEQALARKGFTPGPQTRLPGLHMRLPGLHMRLPGLHMRLTKGVPQGAGLGGGSANAAVLLNFLQALAGKRMAEDRAAEGLAGGGAPGLYPSREAAYPLTESELVGLAAQVGADVPFFLRNVPARALGVGEKLYPLEKGMLKPFAGQWVLLLCPPAHVNTAWAYAQWDKTFLSACDAPCAAFRPAEDFWNCISGLTSFPSQDNKPVSSALQLYNSFESVVFAAYPELLAIKERMLRFGAGQALMSGSGSSIFGVFTSKELAQKAFDAFRAEDYKVFLQSFPAGVSPSW